MRTLPLHALGVVARLVVLQPPAPCRPPHGLQARVASVRWLARRPTEDLPGHGR